MKMSVVVQRKLMALTIGEEVDLRADGIPYSVNYVSENSYRVIAHGNGINVQRVRCNTRRTCLERLAKALGLDEEDEDLE
jgi:hypothetical protein